MQPTTRAALPWALTLFVLSGACALVYEVVWFKLFSQMWGSSALAMASVVACFLGGLGLGSWLGGNWAVRAKSPLLAYAFCELAIALLAILLPAEMRLVSRASAPFTSSLSEQPALLYAARLALNFVLLAPPCMLMGATLPLLVEYFGRAQRTLGVSIAWVYAANTLGAALGAASAGFVLLPTLGLNATNRLAAVFNLAVFGLAVMCSRRQPAGPAVRTTAKAPEPTLGTDSTRASAPFLVAAFFTGAASLCLQIVWSRQAALLLGGSTYTYSMVVAVFLAGIAFGSLAARGLLALGMPTARVLVLGAALVVVATAIGQSQLPTLAHAAGEVRSMRASALSNAAISGLACAGLEFFAAFGMGLFFPALIAERAGGAHNVGRLVAWNTFGSLLGAAVTGLFVFPRLGVHTAMLAAMCVYLVAPWILPRPRARSAAWGDAKPDVARTSAGNMRLVASLVGLSALALVWRPKDPLSTNLGLYWYGAAEVLTTKRPFKQLFFQEGASANILVLEHDDGPRQPGGGWLPSRRLSLRANGKIDASNSIDMATQLAVSYLPRVLRPDAKDVFLIGMGSGTTAGSSLLLDGTKVTVAEIEPAMVEAAREFVEFNHDPHSDPDLRLVLDDGRSFLAGTRDTFDLILSEPTNPWISGVSNLFTRDFYQLVRTRLRPGGVFVQWIQLYSFTPKDYARVAATVLDTFEHALLVRINAGDSVLLAWSGDLALDAQKLDQAQALFDANPNVRIDLERYFGSSDLRSILFKNILLDERGLKRLVVSAGRPELITDQNLRLEYDTPLALFGDEANSRQLVASSIIGQLDVGLHSRLALDWNCDTEQLPAIKSLKTELFQAGMTQQAHSLVELARIWAPEDPELIVDDLLFSQTIEPVEFQDSVQRLVSRHPLEAYRLGKLLSQRDRNAQALNVLEPLTQAQPTSATAWTSLGIVYAALGRDADSKAAQARAFALDPINELTRSIQQVSDESPR